MENNEAIEKYLRQEMTETEKADFEALLAGNASLKAEYMFHVSLVKALKRHKEQAEKHIQQEKAWASSLEQVAEKRESGYILPIWTKNIAAAAFFLSLMGGTYLFFSTKKEKAGNFTTQKEANIEDTLKKVALIPPTTETHTLDSSKLIIDTPNIVKSSKIQDNDSNLVALQQIIDIKQEIGRYQDSIAVISAKKIVGFSGKNTTKITWKTEEETLLHYQKTKKRPDKAEIENWQKQRANYWRELEASKEMWQKYQNR